MQPAVHLYCAEMSNLDSSSCAPWLADEDHARLARIAHPRRRAQYVAGRALLRFALQRWTGRPGRLERLSTTADGKPRCAGGPAFSIAHSGRFVVCAIAPSGDIGVDVEHPCANRSVGAIARQYFHEDESDWLAGQPSDRFYMLWVLKEAYLKAAGAGLAGGLGALRCRVEPPAIEACAGTDGESPSLALLSIGSAFLGIATTGHRFGAVHIEHWQPHSAAGRFGHVVRLIGQQA